MSETRNVLIRVESAEGGEPQQQSVISGVIQRKDARVLLRYAESLSGDTPDPADVTQVRLLAGADRLMMRRDGAYTVSMVFDPAAPYDGRYHTPYGDLPFSLHTAHYALLDADGKGCLELRYTISLQGGEPEPRQLRIIWEDQAPC